MKTRILALTLMVIMLIALFVGCATSGDAKSGDNSPVGTWTVESIDGHPIKDYYTKQAEAYGMDLDTLASTAGIDLTKLDEIMKIELKSDKTASVTQMGENLAEGTWEQDGNKIVITADNDPQTLTLDNGKLTFEVDGTVFALTKK